ncbi:hypothetical protein L484_006282 [Morus notabilis]|uniref:Uncharacterized protein n=1 Tax=Morus notabilis TaxID=981085 RepID=W9QU91_9ROSA|nr:hypothetical protein L484_006282 [Morus notabilis]
MCGKQLKHYPAFCRNGITIAVQSFVFVMANGENHYIAYLEDMCEDKRDQKKVKLQFLMVPWPKMRMDMTISRYEDHHGDDNGSKEDMKELEIPNESLKAIKMMEVTPCDRIMSMNQEMKVVGSELKSEPLLPVDEFCAYVRPYLVVAEGLHPRHMHVFSCGRSL